MYAKAGTSAGPRSALESLQGEPKNPQIHLVICNAAKIAVIALEKIGRFSLNSEVALQDALGQAPKLRFWV